MKRYGQTWVYCLSGVLAISWQLYILLLLFHIIQIPIYLSPKDYLRGIMYSQYIPCIPAVIHSLHELLVISVERNVQQENLSIHISRRKSSWSTYTSTSLTDLSHATSTDKCVLYQRTYTQVHLGFYKLLLSQIMNHTSNTCVRFQISSITRIPRSRSTSLYHHYIIYFPSQLLSTYPMIQGRKYDLI